MGKVDLHIYISREAYENLRAIAEASGKSYGDVIEDLLRGALSIDTKPVALRDVLSRFADGYVEYLVLRKIKNYDYCDAKFSENKYICKTIEIIMKRILRDLAQALKARVLRPDDLLDYAG